MDSPRKARSAGYKLERIYVAEQNYSVVSPDELPESSATAERTVTLSWDWRPLGPRRFEVMLGVEAEPTRQAPDRAQVRLIGVFEAEEGQLAVAFADFLRQNAIAILFPFAREVVSTMTGRGPYGAFHLKPINVVAVLEHARLSDTTGAKYLRAHPEMAASFGLPLEVDEPAVELRAAENAP